MLNDSTTGNMIAGIASFFIPGFGQILKLKILSGILWFVFTGIGYFFLVVPGVILHFFCIINAVAAKSKHSNVRFNS